MKKNKSMRTAMGVVVAALLTTCLIGGTFAKYTTGVSAQNDARTATWGFTSIEDVMLEDLFMENYDNASSEQGRIIAPGTSGSATFSFRYEGGNASAPEVAYRFTVAAGGECDEAIKNNPDIQFAVDNGEYGTWDQMIASLRALSGDASGSKEYEPGQLPEEFYANGDTHTVSWQWLFTDDPETDEQNVVDTKIGNTYPSPECSLSISVIATQIQ